MDAVSSKDGLATPRSDQIRPDQIENARMTARASLQRSSTRVTCRQDESYKLLPERPPYFKVYGAETGKAVQHQSLAMSILGSMILSNLQDSIFYDRII